jgi:EAL domain-containing protein (putative c-di-GMP-specific phosphodiesterase class I)
MIEELGQWVLHTACARVQSWQQSTSSALSLAVNVSRHQLRRPGFVAAVASILEETGLAPSCLELELTETVLMDNADATIEVLGSLSALGVTLAIDDFGTGYSSLSYLSRFAIDKLKIDQSFVRDLPSDAGDATIASTVIAMGKALGLEVVAEGVETEEQARFLKHQGCTLMQGDLFCRPLPAEEALECLIQKLDEPRLACARTSATT